MRFENYNKFIILYIYICKLNLHTELFRPLRSRQCSSDIFIDHETSNLARFSKRFRPICHSVSKFCQLLPLRSPLLSLFLMYKH